jgi:hypothetical protein
MLSVLKSGGPVPWADIIRALPDSREADLRATLWELRSLGFVSIEPNGDIKKIDDMTTLHQG